MYLFQLDELGHLEYQEQQLDLVKKEDIQQLHRCYSTPVMVLRFCKLETQFQP